MAGSRDQTTGMFPYDTVVEYRCDNGSRFEDGYTTQRVACRDNGVWNVTAKSCKGNYQTFALENLKTKYSQHLTTNLPSKLMLQFITITKERVLKKSLVTFPCFAYSDTLYGSVPTSRI
jgi:hypothetical protein